MNFRQPTGKCAACGKSTALPIHQDCGEKLRPLRRRQRGRRPMRARDQAYLAKFGR